MVKGTGRLSQSPFQASVMMPLAIERTFVTCKVQNLLADFWINPFLPRAAKSRHFVILLCLTSDDFTPQRRASGWETGGVSINLTNHNLVFKQP